MEQKILMMIGAAIIVVALALVFMMPQAEPEPEPAPGPGPSPGPSPGLGPTPGPAANDSGATQAGVTSVADANNQFSLDFYKKVIESEEGNVFFSPWSLESALAMTLEGAKGQTYEEMLSVLKLPSDSDTRRSSFAGMMNTLNPEGKAFNLSTANALWAQEDYKFLDEYFDVVKDYYLGEVRNMDFVGDSEGSRQTINRWVEDQTNDKIKDLIPEGIINAMTRLVLTNAVYFKGNWAEQFDEEDTRDADFQVSDSQTVIVEMMSIMDAENFSYMENDKLQLLEMPYEGDELSMVVLLPKTDIDDLDASLDLDSLNAWMGQARRGDVYVYMPKFKFETKYMLEDVLKAMGMPTAFSGAADFSGMTGNKDLSIAAVIHQAYIDVNEEGTEAAAATAVVMAMSAAPAPTPEFRADHPFIFLIREKSTGAILFMGRVMDPSS